MAEQEKTSKSEQEKTSNEIAAFILGSLKADVMHKNRVIQQMGSNKPLLGVSSDDLEDGMTEIRVFSQVEKGNIPLVFLTINHNSKNILLRRSSDVCSNSFFLRQYPHVLQGARRDISTY